MDYPGSVSPPGSPSCSVVRCTDLGIALWRLRTALIPTAFAGVSRFLSRLAQGPQDTKARDQTHI